MADKVKRKLIKPVYEKPVKIKWLNGVPFGGHSNKEIYMEQMMEYDKLLVREAIG